MFSMPVASAGMVSPEDPVPDPPVEVVTAATDRVPVPVPSPTTRLPEVRSAWRAFNIFTKKVPEVIAGSAADQVPSLFTTAKPLKTVKPEELVRRTLTVLTEVAVPERVIAPFAFAVSEAASIVALAEPEYEVAVDVVEEVEEVSEVEEPLQLMAARVFGPTKP